MEVPIVPNMNVINRAEREKTKKKIKLAKCYVASSCI